jgi:hypothetical protein
MKHSSVLASLALWACTVSDVGTVSGQVVAPAPLVRGVESVWIKGSPGPLWALRTVCE